MRFVVDIRKNTQALSLHHHNGGFAMPTQSETTYTAESNGTGWFVGIIVALTLLAIGYLVFSANDRPAASPLLSPHIKVQTAVAHGSATHIGGGLFVTAAHVVGSSKAVTTGPTSLEVLWANKTYDIALLRGPLNDFGALPLLCVTPHPGETAYAYGNPMDLEGIATQVQIAGTARETDLWKMVVPVDGALAPGMSGGGIVAAGRLIGVTVGVSIASLGGFPSLYGVGFIVPGSVVCDLMGRN
jgi:S1-C subfamily serine protease